MYSQKPVSGQGLENLKRHEPNPVSGSLLRRGLSDLVWKHIYALPVAAGLLMGSQAAAQQLPSITSMALQGNNTVSINVTNTQPGWNYFIASKESLWGNSFTDTWTPETNFTAQSSSATVYLPASTNALKFYIVSGFTNCYSGASISILSPTNNAMVSGSVPVTARVISITPVSSLVESVDGSPVQTNYSGPPSFILSSTQFVNGAHTLTVSSSSSLGAKVGQSSASISMFITNLDAPSSNPPVTVVPLNISGNFISSAPTGAAGALSTFFGPISNNPNISYNYTNGIIFADTIIGNRSDVNVEMVNNTASPIQFNNFTYSQSPGVSSSAEFSISGLSFPFTLGANGTKIFRITFEPLVTGPVSATFTPVPQGQSGTSLQLVATGVNQYVANIAVTFTGGGIYNGQAYAYSSQQQGVQGNLISPTPFEPVTSAYATGTYIDSIPVQAGSSQYISITTSYQTGTGLSSPASAAVAQMLVTAPYP